MIPIYCLEKTKILRSPKIPGEGKEMTFSLRGSFFFQKGIVSFYTFLSKKRRLG